MDTAFRHPLVAGQLRKKTETPICVLPLSGRRAGALDIRIFPKHPRPQVTDPFECPRLSDRGVPGRQTHYSLSVLGLETLVLSPQCERIDSWSLYNEDEQMVTKKQKIKYTHYPSGYVGSLTCCSVSCSNVAKKSYPVHREAPVKNSYDPSSLCQAAGRPPRGENISQLTVV